MKDTTMLMGIPCPSCNAYTQIEVPLNGYANWEKGMLIQKAMPELSEVDRETLISGLCPTCQGLVFDE